jgi:hypothetical protein
MRRMTVTFEVAVPDNSSAAEVDSCLGPAARNFRVAMSPIGPTEIRRIAGRDPRASHEDDLDELPGETILLPPVVGDNAQCLCCGRSRADWLAAGGLGRCRQNAGGLHAFSSEGPWVAQLGATGEGVK